jgi:hypothetical protein
MNATRSGWLDPKKLPRNHMIFRSDNKEGLVVVDGKPYALNGRPLPVDVDWLKKNNYSVFGEALRALRPPEPEKKTRDCDSCHAAVPVASRYCPECGNPLQVLWTPGDGGEGERLRKLIDPEDPLGALDAMSNPLDQKALASHRQRVEDMEEITDDEIRAELGGLAGGAIAAVPGESPRPTNPKFRKKAVGSVSHGMPTSRG